MARLDVILQYKIVTHLQGLKHHAVKLATLLYCILQPASSQAVKQEDQAANDQQSGQDVKRNRRRVVVDKVRMEPLVVDYLQFTCLFQTCVLVIDDVYQSLVIANDTQFACRYVSFVEDYAVKSQFLHFAPQWYIAPHKVTELSVTDIGQTIFGRAVFHLKTSVLHLANAQCSIVVLLGQQCSVSRQAAKSE